MKVIDGYICEIDKSLIDLSIIEMDEIVQRLIPIDVSEINIKLRII